MTDTPFLLPVNVSIGGGDESSIDGLMMTMMGSGDNQTMLGPPPLVMGEGGAMMHDMSNIPYPGKFMSIPLWELSVKIAFSALISLMALVGNIIVIFIVWRNKKMHTPTNYYIVNLAISDLMVTLSCTWVHLVDNITEGWVLGAFFCKFNSFAQVLSLVSSIMTLTFISCDRFFGIVFAMKAHVTERRSCLIIPLIWIAAVGISSPLLVYREQSQRQWLDHLEVWCEDVWPAVKHAVDPTTGWAVVSHPSKKFYFTFISVVLYFLPIGVMSVAYSFIIYKLWSSRIPGERIESEVRVQTRTKQKVVIMLIVLLSVFALCWLPFQIIILYSEHRPNKNFPLPAWYSQFSYFANYMAFANSALNPIIYTGFNESYRRGFRYLFSTRSKKNRHYNAINPKGYKTNMNSNGPSQHNSVGYASTKI